MYRHELKYVISRQDADKLKNAFNIVMKRDRFSVHQDYSYLITSLYFDTIDHDAFYEKMNGTKMRKKYRIRLYNHNYDRILLECKHKHENMTYKQAIQLNNEQLNRLLSEDMSMHEDDPELLTQFMIDHRLHYLKPSVIVEYDRLAYVYEPLDVRVTFDDHVATYHYHTDLRNLNAAKAFISELDTVVLEVKFNTIMPDFIKDLISTIPKTRQAISKFTHSKIIQ
jgi:SPX domain protein involved in polyphosphate accumulation